MYGPSPLTIPVLAIGLALCVVAGLVAWMRRSASPTATKWALALLALLAVAGVRELSFAFALGDTTPGILVWPWEFALGYGPLLYLYLAALTKKKQHVSARWLLLPMIVQIVYHVVLTFMSPEAKWRFYYDVDVPAIQPLVNWAGVLFLLVGGSLGYLHARRRGISVRWSSALLVGVLAYAGSWAGALVRQSDPYVMDLPLGIVVGLAGASAGLLVLLQPALPVSLPEGDTLPGRVQMVEDRDLALIQSRLLRIMESDAPYLDPDLSLSELADRVGVPARTLSYVLNEGVGQTYNQFVTGYRVETAKRRLADPSEDHFTVLAIGMESGFSSKSTFNRAFKECAGVSPAAYRRGR
ncbi:MAG: AraC family transcriptional regulator [Bacteroidota bacterium]